MSSRLEEMRKKLKTRPKRVFKKVGEYKTKKYHCTVWKDQIEGWKFAHCVWSYRGKKHSRLIPAVDFESCNKDLWINKYSLPEPAAKALETICRLT